ncbi:MAG: methyltransferase [Gallionellaceae bacterium]|nr:methyltransferase [Gallionellaceae bacterium]
MSHGERKARLEALLLGFQALWRPQPFKIETPDWCAAHPALVAELLALDDETVDRLMPDNQALIALLSGHLPELAELARLIDLPPASQASPHPHPSDDGGRLFTDIPGRKQRQIVAYAAAFGQPRAPVLEWCAGKGHLGRLLAQRWHWPVASLEVDAALCEAGEDLARRAQVDCMQHFVRADALAAGSARHLAGRHAVALHACGDLHTRLIAAVAASASPAVDLVPCCYYRTANETYRPFAETALTLSRDDLHLAVTETATASAKQQRQSRQALAWKLAWVELRRHLTGEAAYTPFPPVPEAWLRGRFGEFIERMLERSHLVADLDAVTPDRFEAIGHARAARMRRLQLVRLAFRRPLEVWLLMDMAVFLERHGYTVAVGPFCEPALTPRNLLISARR